MNWQQVLRGIDAETARAFVTAARHLIDALLIEAERVDQAAAPDPRDYTTAALPRTGPGGGWISHAELRDTTRRLAEAVAAEKWIDGVTTVIQVLAVVGGGL